MPRTRIELTEKVEYLSILDGSGKLDKALEPSLTNDQHLALYRLMVLTRTLDERCISLQRQGRIGTYGPCRGQEAAHCASVFALQPDDWLVPAFREPGAFIHRGWPIEKILFFWGGYEEGCEPPADVNDLPIAVPIASQNPHAMGIAWGMKYRKKNTCALCYFGDGGTSEGDFHESLNFASVYKLPVVYFIQNNQWAISIPREAQTASKTLAQKAVAYGIDGLQIDGNDALAVYAATKEAVDKARSGGGPSLIEAVTYRLGVHTTADDPTKYRDPKEVEKWEKLDPIPRYQKYLVGKKILSDKLVEEIAAESQTKVRAAVEIYESTKNPNPLDIFNHILSELPPELIEQREEYRQALEREGHVSH